jgi:hypothetical protein
MKRLFRPEGPGDPNVSIIGFALLLVAVSSQVGHWMPVAINSMAATLALTLIASAFSSAALLRARKFVVTGTAVIAMALGSSVDHLRSAEAARCS